VPVFDRLFFSWPCTCEPGFGWLNPRLTLRLLAARQTNYKATSLMCTCCEERWRWAEAPIAISNPRRVYPIYPIYAIRGGARELAAICDQRGKSRWKMASAALKVSGSQVISIAVCSSFKLKFNYYDKTKCNDCNSQDI